MVSRDWTSGEKKKKKKKTNRFLLLVVILSVASSLTNGQSNDRCDVTSVLVPDANVRGGTQSPTGSDVTECEMACLEMTSCLGFDWDKEYKECYILTTSDDESIEYNISSVDHYILIKDTNQCIGSCSYPSWVPIVNTHGFYGIPLEGTSGGLMECVKHCTKDASCSAFDWDPFNPDGKRCWIINTTSTTANATGILHYTKNCIPISTTVTFATSITTVPVSSLPTTASSSSSPASSSSSSSAFSSTSSSSSSTTTGSTSKAPMIGTTHSKSTSTPTTTIIPLSSISTSTTPSSTTPSSTTPSSTTPSSTTPSSTTLSSTTLPTLNTTLATVSSILSSQMTNSSSSSSPSSAQTVSKTTLPPGISVASLSSITNRIVSSSTSTASSTTGTSFSATNETRTTLATAATRLSSFTANVSSSSFTGFSGSTTSSASATSNITLNDTMNSNWTTPSLTSSTIDEGASAQGQSPSDAMAIKPAYIVLVALGGGCLLLVLTAVVILCQYPLHRDDDGTLKRELIPYPANSASASSNEIVDMDLFVVDPNPEFRSSGVIATEFEVASVN